ncbi:hypothetical protein KKF34_09150 [Myxococcota bacterium]|nr:hypothetical protein [Myxococcota bacterium]MBU1379367.1 hypothetical protein [Myxococcota bacterium]MBU1497029.1 hypothetical protein [Myxococcota bacterium]
MKNFYIFSAVILSFVALISVVNAGGPQKKAAVLKTRYIGNLTKNSKYNYSAPDRYCILKKDSSDGDLYNGFGWRMGKMNISGLSDQILSAISKSPAVEVIGTPVKDLTTVIKKSGKCNQQDIPIMQMRSDWVSPECGNSIWITTLERLKSLYFIKANSASKSGFLSVLKQKSATKVTFRNDFGVLLNKISFRAHYESWPGKPSPKYVNYSLDNFKSGTTKSFTIPLEISSEGARQKYRLYTLELSTTFKDSTGRTVLIDLSTWVGK